MLTITYTAVDSAAAEQIQRELSAAALELNHHFMIVLVSPESMTDSAVQGSIDAAKRAGQILILAILREAPLPPSLAALPKIDLREGFVPRRMIVHLKRMDRGADVNRANRRALLLAGIVVLTMFLVSILLVGGGVVRFPEEEFNNQETLDAATRDFLIRPTLDGWQPRSTQESLAFPATAAAAPTRLRPFLVVTATAAANSRRE